MSDDLNPAPWIRQIEELNDIEQAQLADNWPLLRINEVLALDLPVWHEKECWKTNTLPPLKRPEGRRLRESIALRGVEDKVIIDCTDGWVADGNHRLQYYRDCRAEGLDVPFAGFIFRTFRSEAEREAFQATRTFAGRIPNRKMKREAARRAIKHHPERSDNWLATDLCIDQATVTSVSDEMVTNGEIEPRPEMRIGADGREHPAPKRKQAKCAAPSHPLLPVILAWHTARGGHGTTSTEPIDLAEAVTIDLVELGACREDHDGIARRKMVTGWLAKHVGHPIGGFLITAYRRSSGFTVFTLVRRRDYRPDIDTPPEHDASNEKAEESED